MKDMGAETVFSLSGDVPLADRSEQAPAPGALRPGSLIHGSMREICRIRKLSGGGAVLHVSTHVGVGERLELELATGHHLSGVVAWRLGPEVGIRFEKPVDVFAIIACDIVNQVDERRRLPRVEVKCPVSLDLDGKRLLGTSRDVSQGGVKIETAAPLAAGQTVQVTLDGLRQVEGNVRWAAGGAAGISFASEIGWQELMPWLKDRRDRALSTKRHHGAQQPRQMPPAAEPALVDPQGSVDLNIPAKVREGMHRWNIEVDAITTRTVEFESFAALSLDTLLWIVLPGLEGWPARIVDLEGYRYVCEFTQPLHPAVLERIIAGVKQRH